MIDVRCPKCNQLLLKTNICIGEIKCVRCKEIIKINVKNDRVSNTIKKNNE